MANYASDQTHLAGVAGVSALHGYTTAFRWAAGIFAACLAVAATVLPSGGAERASAAPEMPRDLALSLDDQRHSSNRSQELT